MYSVKMKRNEEKRERRHYAARRKTISHFAPEFLMISSTLPSDILHVVHSIRKQYKCILSEVFLKMLIFRDFSQLWQLLTTLQLPLALLTIFSLLSLMLFDTYANFQPFSSIVFLVGKFTCLIARPRIKLPARLLTIGLSLYRQQSNLFQVRNFINRGMSVALQPALRLQVLHCLCTAPLFNKAFC